MNSPEPGDPTDKRLEPVLRNLDRLRDALVELSLVLVDYRFQLASNERDQAELLATEALKRAKARETRSLD